MRIVDAVWEKRNLGVDTVEFVVEETDRAEDIIPIIKNNEKGYNVVKIPSTMSALNFVMYELGYVYVEGMCNLVHNLKPNYTSLQKRFSDSVDYRKMDGNDHDRLFSEIEKGMFRTDRIAIDPKFGIGVSNRRYINWLKDEIDKGTDIYKLIYKNDDIGFFSFKETEPGVYFPFLVGVYEAYSRSGLGFVTSMKPIDEAIKRNGKKISTYVSTNNRPPLVQDIDLGYTINKIQTVFVKHC